MSTASEAAAAAAAARAEHVRVMTKLAALHPLPWSYQAFGGSIVMTDALGGQVEMFTMLDYCVACSNLIAATPKREEQPSAA